MSLVYHTTTELFGCAVTVKVYYDYHPFIRGAREHGVPMEPDTPENVEIMDVRIKTGMGWVSVDTDAETEETFAEDILDQIEPI